MDYEHDDRVYYDMMALRSEPEGAERDEQLASLIEEADEHGLANARVAGRVLATVTSQLFSNTDYNVEMLAEAQQIWRENADVIEPPIAQMVMLQSVAVATQLLFSYETPIASVRPLCESNIELSRSVGNSTRLAHRLSMLAAWNAGDAAAAREHYDQAMLQPADARFPEYSFIDMMFLGATDDEAAVARYRQLLADAGDLNRDEPSQGAHAGLLLPAIRAGDSELAAQAFAHRDHDKPYPEDLSYLALTGRFNEAVERVAKVLNDEDDADEPTAHWATELDKGQHIALLLAHLSAAGHGSTRDPRIGEGTINDLLRHYTDQAEHYARKTDEVNGNQVQLSRLHAFWDRHRPAPAAQ